MGIQKRAAVVVTVEWILFTLLAAFVTVSAVFMWEHIGAWFNSDDDFLKGVVIYVLVYLVVTLWINIALSVGVVRGNIAACRVWCVVMAIFTLIQILEFCWTISSLEGYRPTLGKFVAIFYRVYSIGTIISFSNTLSDHRKAKKNGSSMKSNNITSVALAPPPYFIGKDRFGQNYFENKV